MMTSSNGNIFRVTGHLCGEFTGDRWIPRTKASDAGLWWFVDLRLNKRLSKQSWGRWFETLSCPFWRHRNAYNWQCHMRRSYVMLPFACPLKPPAPWIFLTDISLHIDSDPSTGNHLPTHHTVHKRDFLSEVAAEVVTLMNVNVEWSLFLSNINGRHPIACAWGQRMECPMWNYRLIYIANVTLSNGMITVIVI